MINTSIVIPNWNGLERLKKNLPQVLNTKGVDEFIIVDDGSTDKSSEFIRANFPQIKLIEKRNNEGFASTVNLGISQAINPLIFLLNTDAVPRSDCLDSVIPHFNDPRVFSVGCNTGGNWSWAYFKEGYFWHYQVSPKGELSAHETLWANGGSGVFKKSIWDELGGLDEVYNPFYEEDIDLGFRAVKRGYINIWEPLALVEHHKEPGVIMENFSQNTISRIAQRNQLFFIWKNIHDEKLINEHIFALYKKILTNPKYILIVFSALMHILKILSKRSKEKMVSKITDKDILNKYTQDL